MEKQGKNTAWSVEKGYYSRRIAPSWEEAMLCGNGETGALVMGNPLDEKIIFSHEKLFVPIHPKLPPVNTGAHMEEIREMLRRGEYQKAADFVVELSHQEGYGAKRWTDPLLPAASLHVKTEAGSWEDYEKRLSFETGLSTVSFLADGRQVKREFFVSRKDGFCFLKISSEAPVNVSVSLEKFREDIPEGYWHLYDEETAMTAPEYSFLGTSLSYSRTFTLNGEGYRCLLDVQAKDGTISSMETGFRGENTTEFYAVLSLRPGKAEKEDLEEFRKTLEQLPASFEQRLQRHVEIHEKLFNRVSLELDGGEERAVPAEELWETARSGQVPNAFFEKIFYAGRYAILCSSGDWPPTLQGIWTGTMQTPWSSDYTQNGNVQTAIAGMLSGAFPEGMKSYFRYLEWMLPDMRENARRMFGCRGIHLASRTSTHGLNNHFDATWCMTFWTAGAAWACRFFYDYWLYTGNRDFFLQHALPFMKETVLFYEDFLQEGEDGFYVFSPSYSPENNPLNVDSQACVNATMDLAVAREVLNNLIHGCTTLGVESESVKKWKEMLKKIPPYLINSDGALKEWALDSLEDRYDHRHASHLYPLFYGVAKEFREDPRLFEACRKAYEIKMERKKQEAGVMAFGSVQAGMAASHLGDAETAETLLTAMASNNYYPTFASSHDMGPSLFNVDISGGVPALMMECLAQCEEVVSSEEKIVSYKILLLPSLPSSWPKGEIRGMRLRGGFILHLCWEDGKVVSYDIQNPLNQPYTVETR